MRSLDACLPKGIVDVGLVVSVAQVLLLNAHLGIPGVDAPQRSQSLGIIVGVADGVVVAAEAVVVEVVGGGNVSSTGFALWTLAVSSAAFTIFAVEFINDQESESGSYIERLAGKRAAQLLTDGTEYKGMSLKKKITIGVLGALPSFFVLGIMMLYVTVVFRGFVAYNNDSWKVFVTLVAFGIKVLGNKG